jgi:hypothetical protein
VGIKKHLDDSLKRGSRTDLDDFLKETSCRARFYFRIYFMFYFEIFLLLIFPLSASVTGEMKEKGERESWAKRRIQITSNTRCDTMGAGDVEWSRRVFSAEHAQKKERRR